MLEGLDQAVVVAIKSAFEKKAKAGNPLLPGDHPIDAIVTLRARGVVSKQADYEVAPTVEIPFKATLALVLEKSGFMRDKIMELLIAAMTEALNSEAHPDLLTAEKVAQLETRMKDVDAAMEHVNATLAAMPKVRRSGSTVTKKVNVEVVDMVAN